MNMSFKVLIAVLMLWFQFVFAQFELLDAVAKPISLGGAFTSFANSLNNYSLFVFGYALYNHNDHGITHQGSITINFGGEIGRKQMLESLINSFGKK